MPTDVNLSAASALLFGTEPAADWRDDAVSSFIAFLHTNRVPIAVLPRAQQLAAGHASGALHTYVQNECGRYERQLAAYLEVARAWAEQGIEGVLIKSPGYFPYTSSNVDVLVAARQAQAACRILEDLRYSELRMVREPHKRLFRRMDQPHLGFPIHVHTAVAWINCFLTDAQVLHQRRCNDESPLLLHPSPDNVFLITTAHWLYEDKMLALRDLYHASLAVDDGIDWDAVRHRADRGGWRRGLEFALAVYRIAAERSGALSFAEALPTSQLRGRVVRRELQRSTRCTSAPIRLSKPVWKAMHLAKTLADPNLSTVAKIRELAAVVSFAVGAKMPSQRNGPPLVVSVSGPDGAGKTTLARGLQELLEHEVGVTAWYHWGRLGTSPGLDLIKTTGASVLNAARGQHATAVTTSSDGRKLLLARHQRLGRAWCYVLVADFLGRLYARRIQCRIVGGIHIFDRDAIDAAVDLETVYRFPNARLVVSLAPRPAVQMLIEPSDHSDPSVAPPPTARQDARLVAPYRRYESCADALLTAHEPLDSLMDIAARLVLTSYVAAAASRQP
jgi:hypothetical protein